MIPKSSVYFEAAHCQATLSALHLSVIAVTELVSVLP